MLAEFSPTYISEDPGIEELLKLLVAIVDAKLLKTVPLVIFCSDNRIIDSNFIMLHREWVPRRNPSEEGVLGKRGRICPGREGEGKGGGKIHSGRGGRKGGQGKRCGSPHQSQRCPILRCNGWSSEKESTRSPSSQ